MRKFKTTEELEQERQVLLGLIPFKLPTDKILVIYARQSTKGQVFKRRESALQQTEEQLERALEMGWPQELQRLLIENQAKDGKIRNASGRLRIDEREGLTIVMLYIQSGDAGAVMTRDVSRLFRDEDLVGPVTFAKACKEHHVIIITEDHIYNFNDPRRGREDYKKFIEEAQAAADFLNKHVKMMQKNRERKALRGEFFGHPVPIGFMLDEERRFYVPNPDHAGPVKALFKRFRALGGNIALLRREIVGQPIFPDLPPDLLRRMGATNMTKVEGGWTIKSAFGLKLILTNPAYIGHIAYNGRIIKKDAHNAIVDEDDFWFAYYRLAKTDFEGNPIEHPDGLTTRYTQERTSTFTPGALLGGLRNDGAPVITTNIGPHAAVYASSNGKDINYVINDRSAMALHWRGARIISERLDRFFSEHLVYRVGQALQADARTVQRDRTARQLEISYQQANQQLGRILTETEQAQMGERTDPRKVLENSILETKAQIAEKERVGQVALKEMSDEDLQQHYASLKRLRANLAAMQYKLDRLDADEEEKAEAKQKLPEVHQRWAAMPLESKQRFIRAATSRITLDELEIGWLKLTIEWSALLGDDIIDEAYIWTTAGKRWTEEEKRLIHEHYATADRQWLLERLPDRGWQAIGAKAARWGIKRIYRPHSTEDDPIRMVASVTLSVNDWSIIQKYELAMEDIIKTHIYWREFMGFPIETNGDIL